MAASATTVSMAPLAARSEHGPGQAGSLQGFIDVFERGFEVFVDGVGIVVVDGGAQGLELWAQQFGQRKLKRQILFGQIEHLVEQLV